LKLFVLLLISVIPTMIAAQSSLFLRTAAERSRLSGHRFESEVCNVNKDPIAARVFRDYGSIFVTSESVLVPSKCVFDSPATTTEFQSRMKLSGQRIANADITLQSEAMKALNVALQEASERQLRITPLDGSIAGLRSYEDTVKLWNSRFYRALDHWQRRGRISKEDADAARDLTAYEQVPLVLKWEERGIWFSTGFSRSILTSVAAPGTSQHLSGLAFDVVEYRDSRIRAILNKHGWFQTVASDEPHFTYLGNDENELPARGLKPVVRGGYKYWIPAI
jgi:hypothetical protein